LGWQAGVILVGVLLGVVGPLCPIEGDLGGIQVRSARVGKKPGYPLVEGNRAFVVTAEGLQVLDLERMKVTATVPLPNPQPGDLKLNAQPFEGHPYETGIRRLSPRELRVSYSWPFLIHHQVDPPPPHPCVHVIIDTDLMTVASWGVDDVSQDLREYVWLRQVSVGSYEVKLLHLNESFLVEIKGGEVDVRIRLGTDGIVHLVPVDEGLLALGDRGSVYLIKLPQSK
jgi:hypothetical protein